MVVGGCGCHSVNPVTDPPIILPIMGVGDMVVTTIPGALMVIMEGIILDTVVHTGRDTTMVTIMAIMATTTHMQLLTDTVIWIAGILTDMLHPLTLPTTDPKGLPITIPGTGAEQPIPKVPVHPHRGMARVVSSTQHSAVLQHGRAQHSVMQGPYPHPLQMHNVRPLEPMQH